MTPLRQRMIEDLQIRNYSARTIEIYIGRVAQFAQHVGGSPARLGPEEIRDYQRFMIEQKHSWARFNQTTCALRFLYCTTLRRGWMVDHIPYPKQERRLPVVLSQRELARFFAALSNTRHRTVLQTMYGAGLRISEALSLRTRDIDRDRMVLRIVQGKGRRDRYVPLSTSTLEMLRTYWRAYRPGTSWLFPSTTRDAPLSPSVIQRACTPARLAAGIEKPITTHTMRHCCATHLLEAGVDLKTIQDILGHRSLNTTAIYLHIAARALQTIDGPVDLLGRIPEADIEA